MATNCCNQLLVDLRSKVVMGNKSEAIVIVKRLIEEQVDPREILTSGLILGMNEVGLKMAKKEMFIPEVLLSGKVMEAALEIIKPALLQKGSSQAKGKIVMGTVKGDIHDIGKNLVNYILEGGGYEIIDLGVDVPGERFVQAINEHKPVVVGMSAMLTTTMQEMEVNIKLFQQEGCRDRVKVIIGGAPVDRDYAIAIGADGYADDAPSALTEIEKMLS